MVFITEETRRQREAKLATAKAKFNKRWDERYLDKIVARITKAAARRYLGDGYVQSVRVRVRRLSNSDPSKRNRGLMRLEAHLRQIDDRVMVYTDWPSKYVFVSFRPPLT